MQLLYGRDKTDYKVLSKSKNINNSIAAVIIDNYLNYDFVKNTDNYTDVSQEPFSISYCTTNLEGYLNDEMILVSKNGVNESYKTPSKYAHARLFKIEEDSFKDKFFDIFKYSFIDSKDSENYQANEIDDYVGEMIELEKTVPLKEDALKSILYLLFDRFRFISNTIYIISDYDGDMYNTRSIDIIKQVYKYIPYFMRKIIGFASYGTPNQKYSNRIKLVVMTRENYDTEKELKVDLLNLDLLKIEKATSKKSKLVVDYILELEDEKREKLFEVFDLENEKIRLDVNHLFKICLSKKLWEESSDFEKMSSWIYNVINPNELDEDLFYKMMDIIERNLNSDKFNDYLIKILDNESNISEKYLDKDGKLYNLLLFEDILSVDYKKDYKIKIDININYIANWWEEKIVPVLRKKYQGMDFCKVLKNEKEKYERLDLQGENYLKLKNIMVEKIDERLLEEEKLIAKFVDEEQKILKDKFESIKKVNDLNSLESEIQNIDIKYDKNKEILKKECGEKFKKIIKTMQEEYCQDSFEKLNLFEILKKIEKFIEQNREHLSQESIFYFKKFKDKNINDLKQQIEDIDSVFELETLLLPLNQYDELEKAIFNKLYSLIQTFDVNDFNEEKNIFCTKNIFEKINNKTNKLYINLLIDRNLNPNLSDLKDFTRTLQQKIDFIEKNKSIINFDIENYNLNIKVENRIYMIKYADLENLIEYINLKQNKQKLSISKLISNNLNTQRKMFIKNNKKLISLIDKYL